MNFTRVAVLFLLALSSMAQAMPRPAGPYFEPIPDWQTKATLSPPGIVIAPGDEILPQIANSGTPDTGGFFMIFQASNVSETMATFEVNFYDANGESMNMPLAENSDDMTGTPASGFQGTLSPGGYGAQVTIPNGSARGHRLCRGEDGPRRIGGGQRDVRKPGAGPPAVHGRHTAVEPPSQDGLHAVPGRGRVHSFPGVGVDAGSGCDPDRPQRL